MSQEIFTGEYSAISHLKEHKKYFLGKNGPHRRFWNFLTILEQLNFSKNGKKYLKKLKQKVFLLSGPHLR